MEIKTLFAVAVLLVSTSAASFAQNTAEGVTVTDPYVRAVPPGQPNSASFMMLANASAEARALVAAESPAAEVVELHTHTMEEGMMKMRRVDKIDLPANGSATLKPGGYHVMLIGLKQDLVPGEEIDVTLVFDDGSKKQIKAPVRKLRMKMMKKEGAMKHMQH